MPSFVERIKARKFASVSSTALDVGVDGETHARVLVDAGGKLTWGSGSATGDVTLYRESANNLKTDDTLTAPTLTGTTVNASTLVVNNIPIDTSTGVANGFVLTYSIGENKYKPLAGGGGGAGGVSLATAWWLGS